jgi:putative endonuclease
LWDFGFRFRGNYNVHWGEQEVPAFAGMTKVGWGQEIPASAGIEMRNRMINDVTPLLIYFFKIFLKLQFGSMKEYFVYLLTNTFHNVLYIGFTNNIRRRIYEHKRKLVYGFTSKYNCTKLLWFEQFKDVNLAIAREKQLKTR